MIDLNHPLAILASGFPWIEMEAILSPFFARQEGRGKQVEVEDWFGSTLQIADGVRPNAGGRFRTAVGETGLAKILVRTVNKKC